MNSSRDTIRGERMRGQEPLLRRKKVILMAKVKKFDVVASFFRPLIPLFVKGGGSDEK